MHFIQCVRFFALGSVSCTILHKIIISTGDMVRSIEEMYHDMFLVARKTVTEIKVVIRFS